MMVVVFHMRSITYAFVTPELRLHDFHHVHEFGKHPSLRAAMYSDSEGAERISEVRRKDLPRLSFEELDGWQAMLTSDLRFTYLAVYCL